MVEMGITSNDTCVYIHTRSDGVVFYVGVGNPNRPYQDTSRNPHWHNTTEKYAYTVTVLYQNLTWGQACEIEVELIKKYRELSGDKLCNMTDGGDGAKGLKPMLGKKHSEEARAKISEANRKKPPISEETRAKMSASQKTRPPPSEETRAKIREAKKGVPLSEKHRERIRAANKNPSPELRAKISAAGKGKVRSPETRARMSASFKGHKVSEETRAKIRAALKARNP